MTDHQLYLLFMQAWMIAGLCKHKSEPWMFIVIAFGWYLGVALT